MLTFREGEESPRKRNVTSKQLETEVWFLSDDIDPEDDPDPPPPRMISPRTMTRKILS